MPTPSQAAAARLLQQRAAQAAQSDSTAAVVPVPADTLQGSPLADLVDAPSRLIANISDIFSLEAILVSGLKVILIIAISGLMVKLVDRALHIWNKRFEGLALIAPRRQRALTISTLLSSTVR